MGFWVVIGIVVVVVFLGRGLFLGSKTARHFLAAMKHGSLAERNAAARRLGLLILSVVVIVVALRSVSESIEESYQRNDSSVETSQKRKIVGQNIAFLKTKSLPAFKKNLRNAGVSTALIPTVRFNDQTHSVEIVVDDAWQYQPYQERLKMAQNLVSTWRATTDVVVDIEILDKKGKAVGGTELRGRVWVEQ